MVSFINGRYRFFFTLRLLKSIFRFFFPLIEMLSQFSFEFFRDLCVYVFAMISHALQSDVVYDCLLACL